MATIVLRSVKGSALTNTEVDANFSNLNTELGTKLGASDLSSYLQSSTAASTYQPLDADLTAIAGLAGTSGFLKKTTTNTWTLDTSTYLTGITGAQVTTALGYTPVNKAGDTITGPVVIETATGVGLRITQTGSGNALVVEDSANPDATPFVVNGAGQVLIGAETSQNSQSAIVPVFQQHALSNNAATYALTDWQNNGFTGPFVNYNKSRGGAVGTRGIVASGDRLGIIGWGGDDGTAFIPAAQIVAFVDGTPGTNDMPGRLQFYTTADGASSPIEAMRIDSAQRVGLGGAAAAGQSVAIRKNVTGATTSWAVSAYPAIQSDVTSNGGIYYSQPATAAAAFTLTNLFHFNATQGSFGAGSAVTNQYGFYVNSANTGATNNYGFHSNLAAGTGRWNFYAAGTADNYFAGNVGVGVTPSTWGSSYDVIEFPGASIANLNGGTNQQAQYLLNAYDSGTGTWRYKVTGSAAAMYRQTAGTHEFHTAPSGTAGNVITFTQLMTLGSSGLNVSGTVTATSFSGSGASLTGLTSTQVTTALGFTPYNSTNPSGYIAAAYADSAAAAAAATAEGNALAFAIALG